MKNALLSRNGKGFLLCVPVHSFGRVPAGRRDKS